jgi:hypothetical protein
MLIEAVVRRFNAMRAASEATTAARLTGFLSLAVSQVEAERQERTRAGRQFRAIGVAAGAAPVQAVPTTTATHFLYNPDPARSYVVDTIDMMLLSGTATIGATIWAIVTPITSTIPAAATGSLIQSASAGGLQSKAIFATAYTIPTPSGNQQWGIVSQTSQPGGVPGVGGCFSADVRGGIAIPPGKGMGLVVFAGTGTSPLYVPSVTWYEAELDLE